MTRTPLQIIAVDQDARTASAILRDLLETTKPGITRLVTITAGAGFLLAAFLEPVSDLPSMVLTGLACLLGTAAASGGANALNQWLEPKLDACMPRTASRPIPGNRLSRQAVFRWGAFLSIFGITLLALACGPVPALLALACIVSYVFLYTPMKTRSWANTLVGTIPGALPPMLGWTAATASHPLDPQPLIAGGSLAIFMAAWQLPHFFSLAWMYRKQYAAAGFRMLPVSMPSARLNGVVVLATAILLLPATLLPVWIIPSLGLVSAVVGSLATLGLVALSARFALHPTDRNAKSVFLASIMHLPLVLGTMTLEGLVRALLH